MPQEKQKSRTRRSRARSDRVRMEKRMLKVLKALAEAEGDHAWRSAGGNRPPCLRGQDGPLFSADAERDRTAQILYGMTLKASDSHNLKERKR